MVWAWDAVVWAWGGVVWAWDEVVWAWDEVVWGEAVAEEVGWEWEAHGCERHMGAGPEFYENSNIRDLTPKPNERHCHSTRR